MKGEECTWRPDGLAPTISAPLLPELKDTKVGIYRKRHGMRDEHQRSSPDKLDGSHCSDANLLGDLLLLIYVDFVELDPGEAGLV